MAVPDLDSNVNALSTHSLLPPTKPPSHLHPELHLPLLQFLKVFFLHTLKLQVEKTKQVSLQKWRVLHKWNVLQSSKKQKQREQGDSGWLSFPVCLLQGEEWRFPGGVSNHSAGLHSTWQQSTRRKLLSKAMQLFLQISHSF